MFLKPGHLPVAGVVATAILLVSSAYAQHHTPLTMAEAEDLALENEPGQAALIARAEALDERSVAAGQLPEPQLRVGLNNFPIESGGFSTEGMTHALVGLRQMFPKGDTRQIGTRRFRALADEMSETASARNRDVLSAVRQAWLEAYFWQQAQRLVLETRPFFSDLAEITRSLYAVGRRNQQDVLRAELELSRLDDRLIETSRQEQQARAELGRWIGVAAERPIAAKLPDWNQLPARDELVQGMNAHPLLRAADAQVAARAANVDLANEQTKPGWAVDLGYSYREGMLPNGDPRSDFISLSVTVDLPFLGRKDRQDRELAAALSERRAAMNSKEQLARQLFSRFAAEYSRWLEVDHRLSIYENRILPQTAEQAQAALTAYQSDVGDFSDVMRSYIDDLNTRLDHSRLQVERAKSYAVLANLGGLSR